MSDKFEYYKRNWNEWIEKYLGVRLWTKQKEIVEAVQNNKKVSVRSGHGVGKSFVAACIAIAFVFIHENSRCISTAPTFFQVKEILWAEIAKLHERLRKRVKYAGELTQTKLELSAGHFAIGRSTDKPNKFIGQHAGDLLAIFDEACGIPRLLYDAAMGILTAAGNKQLLIGNPTEPGTFFHETHTGDAPGYVRIRISVFDSPNLEKVNGIWRNKDPLPYPALTGIEWINEMRDTYSEKSNYWTSKVLGEFPTSSTDSLIDGRHLAAAIQKGIYLRKTIEEIEEGSLILSSEEIARLMRGRTS